MMRQGHEYHSWKLVGCSDTEENEHPKTPPPVNFLNSVVPPKMNHEQVNVYTYLLDLALGKHNVTTPDNLCGRVGILTGEAGTGKSMITHWLRGTNPNLFTVTATTGSAAVQLGGTTVDRVFCFNRRTGSVDKVRLQKVMRDTAPCIIIDEASMMGYKMAQAVADVLRLYPYKRVIMVGDWAQASPVRDRWPFSSDLFVCSTLLSLQTVVRQGDPEFVSALQELREGSVNEDFFRQCVRREPGPHEQCLCAYATREAADNRNQRLYQWLADSTSGETEWKLDCRLEKRHLDKWRYVPAKAEREIKILDDSRLGNRLKVRAGTRLLVTRNATDLSYVNGDTGTLLGCDTIKRCLRVVLDRTGEEVAVSEYMNEILDPLSDTRYPTERIVGFPVQYGWAVTIHKMQGMTLPKVWVDLSSIYKQPEDSRHGLMYVACSRTRSADQLGIDDLVPVAWCDPAVKNII